MSEPQEYTTLSELSSIFTLEKRLERDFEVLETIGKGGFSTVFRARNRIDKCEYALKKIVLDLKEKSISKIRSEIETVLNEIRFLAKIRNDFVVRYHHSWIEVDLTDNARGIERLPVEYSQQMPVPCGHPGSVADQEMKSRYEDDEGSFELSYSEHSGNYLDMGIEFQSVNTGLKVIKERTSMEILREDDLNESSLGCHQHLKKANDDKIFINNEYYKLTSIKKLVIYIQMELCKQTLGDYINDQKSIRSYMKNLELFKNILKAVDYLHDKEMLIHRDIKPTNIFITNTDGIKVGDFGLATEVFDMKYLNQSKESYRKNSVISNSTCCTDMYQSLQTSQNSLNPSLSFHTKNVGTPHYASPEQLKDNYYDQKSDIFSLGLVLFEILNPMATCMEKYQKFNDLKTKGILPQSLIDTHPNIANLILEMVDHNPIKRPLASEALVKVNNEIIDEQRKSVHKQIPLITMQNSSINACMTVRVLFSDSSAESQIPQVMFAKLVHNQLLLFKSKECPKAIYAYNLKECKIARKGYTDSDEIVIEIDSPIMRNIRIIIMPADYLNFKKTLYSLNSEAGDPQLN